MKIEDNSSGLDRSTSSDNTTEPSVAQRLARWTSLSAEGKAQLVTEALTHNVKSTFRVDSNNDALAKTATSIAGALNKLIDDWSSTGVIPSKDPIIEDPETPGSRETPLTGLDVALKRTRVKHTWHFGLSSPKGSVPYDVAAELKAQGVERRGMENIVVRAIETVHGYLLSDEQTLQGYLDAKTATIANNVRARQAQRRVRSSVNFNPPGTEHHTHGNASGPVPTTRRTILGRPQTK